PLPPSASLPTTFTSSSGVNPMTSVSPSGVTSVTWSLPASRPRLIFFADRTTIWSSNPSTWITSPIARSFTSRISFIAISPPSLVVPFASRTSRLPRPHHVAVGHAALALAGLVWNPSIRQFLLDLLVSLRRRPGLLVQCQSPFATFLLQACPQLGGRSNPDLAAALLVPADP